MWDSKSPGHLIEYRDADICGKHAQGLLVREPRYCQPSCESQLKKEPLGCVDTVDWFMAFCHRWLKWPSPQSMYEHEVAERYTFEPVGS